MNLTPTIDQAWIDEYLYSRLDRKDILQGTVQDKGSYYLSQCPDCGQLSAWIYKDKFKVHCNRQGECGYSKTILEHMNGGERPTGAAFWDVLERLGGIVGVSIPRRELTPEQRESVQRAIEKADKLESALLKAKAALTVEQIAYLVKRGIPAEHLHGLDIGSVVDREHALELGIVQGLEERSDRYLADLWTGRVILAIRDQAGRLHGFIGRDLTGDSEMKYLLSKGLVLNAFGVVGLDVARKFKTLIVVEAVMDLYVLRARGYQNVIAIGGAGTSLGAEKLKMLYKFGVRNLVLLLDNDEAGYKGTSAVFRACVDDDMPDIYVGKWQWDLKDPADVIASGQSIEPALEQKESYEWFARRLASQYPKTDQGVNDLVRDAIVFDGTVNGREKSLQLEKFFWPEICKQAGIDMEFVLLIANEVRAEEAAERQKRRADAAAEAALKAYQEGDTETFVSLLHEVRRHLLGEQRLDPIVKVSDRLERHTEYLARTRGQRWIGLIQKTLPELDEATLGLRGLIAIPAGPNSGKTILASQLFQDVLFANPDACGVFISWEMTGDEILTRMKSRLTNTEWRDLRLKNTPELLAEADRAVSIIGDRFTIIDQGNCSKYDLTAERVIREIDWIKRDTGCKRCVVVLDYAQLWPVPDTGRPLTDIQRDDYIVDELKKIRYHLGEDPFLVIYETNKTDGYSGKNLSKMKGSGRGAYGSDCVFFLNQLSDEDLLENFILHNGGIVPRAKYSDEAPPTGRELQRQAEEIRAILKTRGYDYLELNISKGRDGTEKKRIFLTNYHKFSQVEQGLRC